MSHDNSYKQAIIKLKRIGGAGKFLDYNRQISCFYTFYKAVQTAGLLIILGSAKKKI